MKTPRTRFVLSLAAIAALSATPAAASPNQETVVPPSNSAATQYTETFPTTGGDKKTDQKSKQTPAKALGAHNAQKLEEQGPEGRATAEAAAATAPTPVAQTPRSQGDGGGQGGGGNSEGGTAVPQSRSGGPADERASVSLPASEPAGSSGVGSALGEATGLSSGGQSGPLLALLILATVLWSIAYFWRQRRQVG
jgi:hypothetical protein